MSEISNIRTNPFTSATSWREMDQETRTIAELDELPGIYGFRLKDRPRQDYIIVSENATGGVTFDIVTTAPSAGQVRIDYESGLCVFNVADDGTECIIDYQGGGSVASKENIQSTVDAATELLVPVGTILFLAPGYFSATANGGSYTSVATNTVAGIKTWLTSNGYDAYYQVCDGSALNDADSPIFNGAGRYLPDLTDSRFLRGATVSGTVAASSGTATAANESSHTHAGPSHTHVLSSAGYAKILASPSDNRLYANNVTVSWNATKYNAITGGIGANTSDTSSNGAAVTLGGATDSGGTGNTGAGSAHTHTITVSAVEPKYFSGFYIMRVK